MKIKDDLMRSYRDGKERRRLKEIIPVLSMIAAMPKNSKVEEEGVNNVLIEAERNLESIKTPESSLERSVFNMAYNNSEKQYILNAVGATTVISTSIYYLIDKLF